MSIIQPLGRSMSEPNIHDQRGRHEAPVAIKFKAERILNRCKSAVHLWYSFVTNVSFLSPKRRIP